MLTPVLLLRRRLRLFALPSSAAVELVARHKANHERLAAQAARVPHLMLIV